MTPPAQRVHVRAEVRRAIADVCRDSPDGLETGGVLLGHQASESLDVTVAGDPGPAAICTAASFRRDPGHAQALADRAWATDSSVWIGDWHTHPSGPTHPSPLDLSTYLALLDDHALNFQMFLALIVLPADGHPVLYPWLIRRGSAELAPLAWP